MVYFILGYVLAVIFPIPYLNMFIISIWAKIGIQIAAWIKGSETTPVVTSSPGVTVPIVAPHPSTQRVVPKDHTSSF